MEKVLLSCNRTIFEGHRCQGYFIQNEIYKPAVTDGGIMAGGNYVLSKKAMNNPCETISRIRFNSYFQQTLLPQAIVDEVCRLSSTSDT